eukprot:129117_1
MPKCYPTENKGNEENGTHKHVSGHSTSTLPLALSLCNALVEFAASLTLCAYFGLRSIKVTIADCGKHSVNRESSAKRNCIDKCCWENDNTTFHLSCISKSRK